MTEEPHVRRILPQAPRSVLAILVLSSLTSACVGEALVIPCAPGFERVGVECVDIDECALDEAGCSADAQCANTPGGFSCICNPGFDGDGLSCADIDECAAEMDDCAENARCTNTPGAFECACDSGYQGNGVICSDVDECAAETDDCAENARCTNTPGAFECTCNSGFEGDGLTCTDLDECTGGTANCDANATCTNVVGTFECSCNPGYGGDGLVCSDIDECVNGTSNCAENATCTNVPGAFECACDAGYEGDGVVCSDIDECAAELDNCDVNASCENTPGAFGCACNAGFEGTGVVCTDIDECDRGLDNCAPNASCDNDPGGFMCSCLPGFSGNGLTCTDIDECATGAANCDDNASCTNSPGSFSCTCDLGYTGTGFVCEPAFDIVLVFTNPPSAAERAAFEAAEARWEELIIADEPDVRVSAAACGIPSGFEAVDDLVIEVRLQAIDGVGGVLGSAGPRCLRSGGGRPINGVMTFDTADNANMISRGTFEAVILHEMGHVLGIGTLWSRRSLLSGQSCPNGDGTDVRFTGAGATRAWQSLGGTGNVPVENERGQGSCDSHWRESSSLRQELMSSALSTGNQLSIITLQSLADVGYTVAPNSRADAFTRGTGTPLVGNIPGVLEVLEDDIDRGPLYEVNPDGSLTRIR